MTQMQEPSALGRIVNLVRDLRRRCAWDRAQTPQTLRPYLVEEVLELDQALASGSPEQVRTELGDLLLHLAFQIVLAEEAGSFGAEDVTRAVEVKMWRRHPHLFDRDGAPTDRAGPAREHPGWERQKVRERTSPHHSVLDGLPPTLPAILMAFRLQERAAGVGFDWPDARGPRDKVTEETAELDQAIEAGDATEVEAELGDLIFAVVNLARKLQCDPRSALEKANARFTQRFRSVETLAAARGVDIAEASLEQLESLWQEAKR